VLPEDLPPAGYCPGRRFLMVREIVSVETFRRTRRGEEGVGSEATTSLRGYCTLQAVPFKVKVAGLGLEPK
jgi:hypothetical protein